MWSATPTPTTVITITFNRTGLGTEIGQYITEEGLIESYQGTVVLIFTQME